MSLLRIMLVALTIFATLLSGAMAAGHGDWTGDQGSEIALPANPSSLHANCCDEMPDQSFGCHVLPAIEPRMALATPRLVQSRAIVFGMPWLMTGLTPSGLLDPPRQA